MTFAERESSRTRGERVELYRIAGVDPSMESLATSITIGPGLGQFAYSTTRITRTGGNRVNWMPGMSTYMERSIRDLQNTFPNVKRVNLAVAWHGTDLRAAENKCRPRTGSREEVIEGFNWFVGGEGTSNAPLTSDPEKVDGAPADRAVYEAILALRAAGYHVTVYPMLFMDIPVGNDRPNPYGGVGQNAYPWCGRIAVHPAPGQPGSVDLTSAAESQVDAFFGDALPSHFGWNQQNLRVMYTGGANDWGYRRFVYHLATIAKMANADGFLIGSQLAGITTARSETNVFPGVNKLRGIVTALRAYLPGVELSYAADWTEYGAYVPPGGADVLFPLDALWEQLDYVGIDWTAPLSDWRDGDMHRDRQAGYASIYDADYLAANVRGGEAFDWRYAGTPERKGQFRTPIEDTAYNEPWIFRPKDIRNWWERRHHPRIGGVRQSSWTYWEPKEKPIRITAAAVRPVNKGTNGSRDNSMPPFSTEAPDPVIQRAGLETLLKDWAANGDMILSAAPWFWDARPYPAHPAADSRVDVWRKSNSLCGRTWPGRGYLGEWIPEIALTDAEQPISRRGTTFAPVAIRRGTITDSGTIDETELEVRVQRGTALDSLLMGGPPAYGLNLTVWQGHVGDNPDMPEHYPVAWSGRILNAEPVDHELVLKCEPLQAAMKRTGLSRYFQTSCPLVLYGPRCRANRPRVTITRTVESISGTSVRLTAAIPNNPGRAKFAAGLIEWDAAGGRHLRTIVEMPDDRTVRLRGTTKGLAAGVKVSMSLGCNHNQNDCSDLHDNILNYGGQPSIPKENPYSSKNQFF